MDRKCNKISNDIICDKKDWENTAENIILYPNWKQGLYTLNSKMMLKWITIVLTYLRIERIYLCTMTTKLLKYSYNTYWINWRIWSLNL